MPSINLIKSSDGTGNVPLITVQSVRSPGATTIVVDTVENLNATFMGSMGTPHTFIDPVTAEEITVISEATCVDFTGSVSGTNIEITSIAPGFTDLGNQVGDVIVIKPTNDWANNVAAVIDTEHNQDGTHAAITPTQILTLSGITNAAARPAVGTATINGEIRGRGYVSTAANDGFLRLSAGGGTDAGNKTTIDITGYSSDADMNQAVVIKNGSTELARFSSEQTGSIGAAWKYYLPTFAGLTVGNGTANGYYTIIGKTMLVRGYIIFGSTTAVTGSVTVNAPLAIRSHVYHTAIGNTVLSDSSAGSVCYGKAYFIAGPQAVGIGVSNTAGTYETLNTLSATVPFTWAVNDVITYCFTAELA